MQTTQSSEDASSLQQGASKHPILVAIAIVLTLALLPVVVYLDLRNLTSDALTNQAKDLGIVITDFRSYYTNSVIGKIQAAEGMAIPTHDYLNVKGGIPIPATLSLELGAVIAERAKAIKYKFASDSPFTNRAAHNLDSFEANSLKEFRADPTNLDNFKIEHSGDASTRVVRLALPVLMGQNCVKCHNSHPQSTKRDWKVGDVRGLQVVTVEQPLARNLFSFKHLLLYFLIAGLGGAAIIVIQLRQAKKVQHLNADLIQSNDFLASVSMKIAKYLSPQVYKSIFSGEKDATISTERKKLTIFFSDIKDFTSTTESLQPEELTNLLNEYFREMSAIALLHGATIDKFIGDAILAFFGDPETKGPKGDALACVSMAVAMQQRLDDLGKEWKSRGIDNPLKARMGINTGYCNVGNFGSDSRMDYTIVGAEANLAARLESVAEAGGIILSYETYALVRDHFEAKEMAPITLKGIGRPVIPYALFNFLNKKQADITDNAAAVIDLSGLTAEQADEVKRVIATIKSR